jgi:hypothetical protein
MMAIGCSLFAAYFTHDLPTLRRSISRTARKPSSSPGVLVVATASIELNAWYAEM